MNGQGTENQRRKVTIILSLILSALLIETIGQWILSAVGVTWVNPTGVHVVIGAVVFGPLAAPWLAFGTLLAGLMSQGIVVSTIDAIAVAASVGLCGAIWQTLLNEPNAFRWTRQYVFIALSGVGLLAAVDGFLSTLFGVAPFSIVAVTTVSSTVPLVVVVTPVAWYLTHRAVDSDGVAQPRAGQGNADTAASANPSRKLSTIGTETLLLSHRTTHSAFGIVIAVWVTGGYAMGFVFRATDLVPASRIGRRLIPPVGRFLELVGPQGYVLQVTLGILSLIVLTVLVWGLPDH